MSSVSKAMPIVRQLALTATRPSALPTLNLIKATSPRVFNALTASASTAASCFATFYYLGCTQHDTRASHLTSTSIAVLLMMAKQRITPIRTKRSRTKRRLSPWTPSMASQDSLCKSWPLPSDCAPGTTYITVAMRKTRNKLRLRHVASVSRINIEIGGRVRWDRAVKYKYTIILPIRNRRQKLSSVYLPCCNVLTASTSWQVEQRLRCKC